jgi:hypothetical protein
MNQENQWVPLINAVEIIMLEQISTNSLENASFMSESIFDAIIIIQKSETNFYNSPVIAALLGFSLAFIANIVNDHRKEKKELDRYEYFILSKTKDIIESDQINSKMVENFVFKLYTDLRFSKLESSQVVIDLLKKSNEDDESNQAKMDKVDSRLRKLKEGGTISQIKAKIKFWLYK